MWGEDMNDDTKKLIVIAVAFFLAGSILGMDYNNYQGELNQEYKSYLAEYEPTCVTSEEVRYAIHETLKARGCNDEGCYVQTDTSDCRLTQGFFIDVLRELDGKFLVEVIWNEPKDFDQWKHDNSKLYWADLVKRLRVVAVSADECNNFSLYEVGDEYRGYTDTYMPYLSSYMEFCKFFTQTENIRMLVLDDSYRREYTDVNESQIIGRQFNAGRGVSAVYHTEYGAMLKVSRCGCNNEYKYIQPVFVVHHEDYLEFYKILESVYNISTQIKEPPQDIPTVLEVNITTPDAPILNPCDAYINNSNWKCEYNESTGHIWITAVGWCNNCEGEGCEPEELPEPPKITELGDEWEDVNESIFEMYPIHNSPTIYTMDYPKERKYFNPWWVSQ
jgi:hypothetical protein